MRVLKAFNSLAWEETDIQIKCEFLNSLKFVMSASTKEMVGERQKVSLKINIMIINCHQFHTRQEIRREQQTKVEDNLSILIR